MPPKLRPPRGRRRGGRRPSLVIARLTAYRAQARPRDAQARGLRLREIREEGATFVDRPRNVNSSRRRRCRTRSRPATSSSACRRGRRSPVHNSRDASRIASSHRRDAYPTGLFAHRRSPSPRSPRTRSGPMRTTPRTGRRPRAAAARRRRPTSPRSRRAGARCARRATAIPSSLCVENNHCFRSSTPSSRRGEATIVAGLHGPWDDRRHRADGGGRFLQSIALRSRAGPRDYLHKHTTYELVANVACTNPSG